ncbi:MAG TPA: hypothetical protein PLR99_33105, partial [Polyangiaceae bacterium]|nr:hypothetical protein [Polyangiaceae bacterium]
MTRSSGSIAARAAWAAFASAAIAAAVAAIASLAKDLPKGTKLALADLLVVRQTDRHLVAVATELARELDGASDARSAARVVDDEQREVTSTGIRLAVYGAGARPLAGDANVPLVEAGACASARGLRVCGVPAGDARVVAGTLRQTSYGSLALAAAVAAALAG